MEVALPRGNAEVHVRRLALQVDQLSAWAFVGAAILLFAATRAGRLFALLHQNRGGMELAGYLALGVFLGVLIFAVRRRQCSAWQSTLHLMIAVVGGNALGIIFIWPFVPASYSVALVPLLRDTLSGGAVMATMSLPFAIGMLWLSRRYGSHSALTERRGRVVTEIMRRRFARDQAGTREGER